MQVTSLNDRQLIRNYLEGNEKSFEVLLARHQSKIYTSIYMFVKDDSTANDIFQDTFIKIIDTIRKGKYNDEGKFLQWALRISYNLCVDHFRRNKRRPIKTTSNGEFDIFDVLESPERNAEGEMIRGQKHSSIRRLVDQLPPEQREVVVLRHYAELSFKEIAELTRVSINTALGRMRYALINMRKMLAESDVNFH